MGRNVSLFCKKVKDLTPDLLLVFVTLAVITLLFTNWYDPFSPVEPELLKNPNFSEGLSFWEHSKLPDNVAIEDQGIVKLHSTNPQSHVSITQIITDPLRFKFLRLSGQVKTEDVKPGKRGWQKARLILSSYDANGKWISSPHYVTALTGTNDWREYSEVFRIIPAAKQLHVSAQLPNAIGTMWIKSLSLMEVLKKRSVFYYNTGFLILWGVFLAILLVPYIISSYSLIWRLVVVACILSVLIGSLAPGKQKNEFLKDSALTIQKMVQPHKGIKSVAPSDIKNKMIQEDIQWQKVSKTIFKSGHFIFFALLAVTLRLSIPPDRKRFLIPDLMMVAATTELMQNFINGRNPLFMDLLIDLSGIFLGLLLAQAWLQIKKKRLA